MHRAPYVWTEQYQAAIFEIDSQKHFVEAALAEDAILETEVRIDSVVGQPR